MEYPDLSKTYGRLNPKLLRMCERMIIQKPSNKKLILKVLDEVIKQSHFSNFPNPPHRLMIEYCDEKQIVFTNGVYLIGVYEKKGKYMVKLRSYYFGKFGKLRFPIKKLREQHKNVFDAMGDVFMQDAVMEEMYFDK